MTNGAHNKAILEPLLRAMQDFEAPQVQSLLQELMAHDAVAHMCLPFNDVTGP
ncbi:MAG: polyketide cyclase, partial [Oceanospirillaceae bacterium]|nr:polyketide cyclase [Oceanospirillaceae bacterium]